MYLSCLREQGLIDRNSNRPLARIGCECAKSVLLAEIVKHDFRVVGGFARTETTLQRTDCQILLYSTVQSQQGEDQESHTVRNTGIFRDNRLVCAIHIFVIAEV